MTRQLTITEALAEIKTLEKRIQKKQEFVGSFLYRQEQFKDPLAAQGGSPAALPRIRCWWWRRGSTRG